MALDVSRRKAHHNFKMHQIQTQYLAWFHFPEFQNAKYISLIVNCNDIETQFNSLGEWKRVEESKPLATTAFNQF